MESRQGLHLSSQVRQPINPLTLVACLGRVVYSETENVMLQHKRVVQGLEHEHLGKWVRRVFIALQPSYDTDDDAAVEHGLRVDCGDHSADVLEAETGELFHDGLRPLELLALKSHQRSLCVVKIYYVRPRADVVELQVVLLHELFADVVEIRVHFEDVVVAIFALLSKPVSRRPLRMQCCQHKSTCGNRCLQVKVHALSPC